MNKKTLRIVIAFILLVAIALGAFLLFRGKNSDDGTVENTNGGPEQSKILVVYFSRAGENYEVGNVEIGNTELVARRIATNLSADEFKIEPVEAYPEDYDETLERAEKEKDEKARPEYVGDVNISKYETIFIGYPIWHSDAPMIVYNFIESHKWSGKDVVLFSTYGSSGSDETYNTLHEKMNGASFNKGVFGITGEDARTEAGLLRVDTWLIDLGLMK